MKKCHTCLLDKSESEFHPKRYKSGHVGLRAYCKECSKRARDEWRARSPKDNDRNKAYNRVNAEQIRGKKLAKKYWPHMTWQEASAEWNRLYLEQDAKCAFGHEVKVLHVDHCHTTKKVRGLLCYNCNNGIGRFKDDIDVLLKAIRYIQKHKAS